MSCARSAARTSKSRKSARGPAALRAASRPRRLGRRARPWAPFAVFDQLIIARLLVRAEQGADLPVHLHFLGVQRFATAGHDFARQRAALLAILTEDIARAILLRVVQVELARDRAQAPALEQLARIPKHAFVPALQHGAR